MTPDLQKLRRFALAIGLLLITYSLAAVELDVGETVHPLGIPLKINRPDWLGIGLVLASLYSIVRFFVYGMCLQTSPAKGRKTLTEGRLVRPIAYSGVTGRGTDEAVGRLEDQILEFFPGGSRESLDVEASFGIESVAEFQFKVTRRMRIYGRLVDLDYTAPIWVNVIALALWGWRVI